MKKIFTLSLFFLFSFALGAQVPQLVRFQGIARNTGTGELLKEKDIKVKLSVLENSPVGISIYSDEQLVQTNGQGYFSMNLGEGGPDEFEQIDWGAAEYYLKVEISPTGLGNDFDQLGDPQQILSVPYALMANNGVPTGTIVAWGGDVTSSPVPFGWALCDGATVSGTDQKYKRLYSAIGTNFGGDPNTHIFNLPDFRGRFLRGVDSGAGRDPDVTERTAMKTGGNVDDKVGSVQGRATARPSVNFTGTTASAGAHTHRVAYANSATGTTAGDLGSSEALARFGNTNVPGNTVGTDNHEYDLQGVANVTPNVGNSSEAGAHTHTFSVTAGGDKETRPINAYVYYIIKL